jgi:dihydrofolate reductase
MPPLRAGRATLSAAIVVGTDPWSAGEVRVLRQSTTDCPWTTDTTDSKFSWRNSELIKDELVEAVTDLKAEAGIKGILIPGSISVVQQLLAAGLVDELRLLVHPVAARKGRRLFDDGDAAYHLKMTATEAFPTGVIRVIYSPTGAPAKIGYDAIKDRVPEGK